MIHRLAPSLKPHIGCNIIDINPGPALWSSKLHDFLQPRSHVLVEPDPIYHEPYIKPLLDASGSRYHLRDWDYRECFDLNRYVSDGLIATSQGGNNAGGCSTSRNDSLLIVASLTRSIGRGRPNALIGANRFLKSAQNMDGLNAQGPVRMLMWLPEPEKQSFLPQTVFHRSRFSLMLEMYFHVEEIVTGGRQSRQRRETSLDVESGKRVARRMTATGIKIPPDRQDEIQKKVQEILASSSGLETTVATDAPRDWEKDWEKELQQLEDAFAKKKFAQYVSPEEHPNGKRDKTARGVIRKILTAKFKRLQDLRWNLKFVDKKKLALDRFLAEEAEIDALDIKLLHSTLDPQQRESTMIKRDELYKSLKDRLVYQTISFPSELAFLGDDRRAFALEPPLLMWDRRTAEPLLAHDDEIAPQKKKVSLLDFQPLVPNPYPMTMEQAVYFNHILLNIFLNGTNTPKLLNSVAPGAFEALAPRVPSLADPLKGGRGSADELRVRSLTPEMAYGLALAWDQWPFKPDFLDVIAGDPRLEHLVPSGAGGALGATVRKG